MNVAECFASIQGESTFAGLPCYFIRLAGCNLRCVYCDTPGAWAGGTEQGIPELAEAFRASGLTLAEITGGEPLLQAGLLARCGAVLFSPVRDRLPGRDLAAWVLEARLPVRLQPQLHRVLGVA